MNDLSKEKTIRRSAIFSPCSDATARILCGCGTVAFGAGESVSKDMLGMLGLVLSGGFTISSAEGGRVLMNSVRAGDVFGAATVFLGGNDISGITATKKSEVLFVPRGVLERVFASDSAVSAAYARFLSEKIRFLNKKIIALSSPRADVALAGFIIDECGGKGEMELNCAACAKKLGIGRTTLYRAVGTLESEGIISYSSGKIIISDAEKLALRRENI